MIPYGRQTISDEDIDAVCAVLRSDFLTQGPAVERFEKAVATLVGAAHSVAVNSATSALHIACMALDLGPGDMLWTVPNTFVASANCAFYCGAAVDFVDIDAATGNMCIAALRAKLEEAKASGTLPKVLIPVHFAGEPCDMRAIFDLSRLYGFRIIEDASHAIGGFYAGDRIGTCAFSDITIFSFHPVKIVTTAEGGLATTQDAELARRMALVRSHGITRDAAYMPDEADGPWAYQQIALGYNYRMTDMQAALGCSQLTALDRFIARRHRLAQRYDQAFETCPSIGRPIRAPDNVSALHLYVIHVAAERRAAIFAQLRRADIGVNVHYIPVHLQPYYQKMGFRAGQFPQAEAHYAQAISLPMFFSLTLEEQDTVIAAVKSAAL